MTSRWDGEEEDARAARLAAEELAALLARASGEAVTIGNEFAEVRIVPVVTRNGTRLLVQSPRSGQWVALCPLELEALTWQDTATFSAMVGNPYGPMVREDEPLPADGSGSTDGSGPVGGEGAP